MATTTTNLGLIEPAGQDRALVANINTNSEKIDAEAGKVRDNFALVQNGDTATQAISKDQLVVWKGVLKKATANIASGATLSNSNLTDDDIATELAALNSKMANYSGTGNNPNDDLNSITDTGFYSTTSSGHTPNGGSFYGLLIVVHGAYNYISQLAINVSNGEMYVRCSTDGGSNWIAWKQFGFAS